jgi:hypothetical protein
LPVVGFLPKAGLLIVGRPANFLSSLTKDGGRDASAAG